MASPLLLGDAVGTLRAASSSSSPAAAATAVGSLSLGGEGQGQGVEPHPKADSIDTPAEVEVDEVLRDVVLPGAVERLTKVTESERRIPKNATWSSGMKPREFASRLPKVLGYPREEPREEPRDRISRATSSTPLQGMKGSPTAGVWLTHFLLAAGVGSNIHCVYVCIIWSASTLESKRKIKLCCLLRMASVRIFLCCNVGGVLQVVNRTSSNMKYTYCCR